MFHRYGSPDPLERLFVHWLGYNYSVRFTVDFVGDGQLKSRRLSSPYFDVKVLRMKWRNYSIYFCRFERIQLDWCCAFLVGNIIYHRVPPGLEKQWVIPTVFGGVFEHVFAVCECYITNYGHFTQDIIGSLLCVPPEMLMKCSFVLSRRANSSFVHEALGWFGLGDRLVVLTRQVYIWANNVYRFDPSRCGEQDPALLMRFRGFVSHKFDLDRKHARRCSFMNRNASEFRHIANMDEIFRYCQATFPEFPWEWIRSTGSIRINAILWNNVRFFMAPTGAGCANNLYMQPGIVFCEIHADSGFMHHVHVAQIIGLHCIVARLPQMRHFGLSTNILPLAKARLLLAQALIYLRGEKG
jgi:hypothetical protein